MQMCANVGLSAAQWADVYLIKHLENKHAHLEEEKRW